MDKPKQTNRTGQHLGEEDFRKWQQGTMSDQEQKAFLMHTTECTFCAENWMKFLAGEELQEPPAYLQEEIMERVRQPDLQIQKQVRRTSRNLQLFIYSFKVGIGLAFSILMLFTMNISTATRDGQMRAASQKQQTYSRQVRDKTEHVTEYLQKLSQGWIHFDSSDREE